MPKSERVPATAPAAAPNVGPAIGTMKISASSTPHEPPHSRPGPVRLPRVVVDGLRWPGGQLTSAASSTVASPADTSRWSRGSVAAAPSGSAKRQTTSVFISSVDQPGDSAAGDGVGAAGDVELAVDGQRLRLDRVGRQVQARADLAERHVA